MTRDSPQADIRVGDCIEQMRTLPDASVHCCVTSPPYYGLRQYMANGVRLRDDITPEKREEIVSRLASLGVLPIDQTSV